MIFAAALIMAQAAVTPPAQPVQQAPITVNKKKSKEHCVFMEVTGSHARQRICQDEAGNSNAPGVSDSAPNSGMLRSMPGAPGNFLKTTLGATPH